LSLELLNTIGTLVTVLIVATAAIAALVQLRHLRASNQITAMISIGAAFEDKEFRDALDLVRRHLAQAIEMPVFREYVATLTRGITPPDVDAEKKEVRRAAILMGNRFEELGIMLKHRIVDEAMFLDRYSRNIRGAWRALVPLIAFMRKVADDPAIYENFELLVVRAEEFDRAHPSAYPVGVRRLEDASPWPVPAASPTSAPTEGQA